MTAPAMAVAAGIDRRPEPGTGETRPRRRATRTSITSVTSIGTVPVIPEVDSGLVEQFRRKPLKVIIDDYLLGILVILVGIGVVCVWISAYNLFKRLGTSEPE